MKINIGVLIFAVVAGVPLWTVTTRPWGLAAADAYVVVIVIGFVVSAIIGLLDRRRARRREHDEVRC